MWVAVEVENPGDEAAPLPLPGAVLLLWYKVACKDFDGLVLQGYCERNALLRVSWGPACSCIAPVREALEKVLVAHARPTLPHLIFHVVR